MEERKMEWGDEWDVFYCWGMPYLLEDTINLSHTMRENNEISSYASTTDQGIHHGQTVGLAGT